LSAQNSASLNLGDPAVAALAARFARRTAFLSVPGAATRMALCVPPLFGLASMLLGQDSNWDLRNYHLYNGYAVVNGRVGFDPAPAAFQTYSNPALDIFTIC
jgi:hypothetical protein